MYRTALAATLTLMLAAVGFAVPNAYAQCGPKGTDPCPPPPPKEGICHNIGGPEQLGADCDVVTGACLVGLVGGQTLIVPAGNFLGIIVGTDSPGALAAHLAHGDGPIQLIFDPPLHLASTGQNHSASNVECMGTRVIAQPPEPGN